jgi:type IV fimbrial biogenesis protein FimT
MLKRHTPIYSRGLTLTELLIVLTLSSILLAIGAPALGQWVRDIEVRSNASSLLAVLHAARTEAVTRNAWVRLQLRDTQGRPGW